MREHRNSFSKIFFYGGASLFLVVYFLRSYGFETGAWVLGALLYCGCLFLLFPAALQLRLNGAAALHWLNWVRVAYIPVFLGLAVVFASWLPLLEISALGFAASIISAIVAFRRHSSSNG